MTLSLNYATFYFKTLLRQPSYVLSTLIFPSLFFLMFAHPNAVDENSSNLLLASFSAFAVLGVAFLDFGVTIAKERSTDWSNYVRSLPVSPGRVFLGRALNALLFSLLAALLVIVTVNASATPNITSVGYLKLLGALIVGMVPFSLMGIAIGYLTTSASSLSVSNLLYLTLSFLGGLWIPPNGLPEKVADFSQYTPTRFYGEFVWSAVLENHKLQEQYIWSFVIYTFAAGLIAYWAYKRDIK